MIWLCVLHPIMSPKCISWLSNHSMQTCHHHTSYSHSQEIQKYDHSCIMHRHNYQFIFNFIHVFLPDISWQLFLHLLDNVFQSILPVFFPIHPLQCSHRYHVCHAYTTFIPIHVQIFCFPLILHNNQNTKTIWYLHTIYHARACLYLSCLLFSSYLFPIMYATLRLWDGLSYITAC